MSSLYPKFGYQRIGLFVVFTFILMIATLIVYSLMTVELHAQPSFPSTPDPAPIDGGLGLLAAAGGAYAYNRLRASKANFTGTEDADEKNI
jgi:hypothetical protein